MDKRELRIGNIAYRVFDSPLNPNDKELIHIGAINGEYNTYCCIEDSIGKIEELSPVKLNKQWFLHLGFYEDEIGYMCFNDNLYSFVDREEDGFMLVVGDVEYKETYISYVHELQNLFFFLTKIELCLK